MKSLKLMIAGVFLLAVAFIPALTVSAAPNINDQLCEGANLEFGSDEGCDTSEEQNAAAVNSLVETVINIFSWIVGVISVIMIIYGGFRYITSGGDTTKVGSAKNTILYAIIGLIIVALAQIIVKFVLGTVGDLTTQSGSVFLN